MPTYENSFPTSNQYYPLFEGFKSGPRKASAYTFVHILALSPVHICVLQGKMVRGFSYYFFGRHCPLQYLPMKKENFES
jgi:hypothetical protein